MRSGLTRKFIVSTILVTPVAIFLALVSTGGGHGNYFFAKIFFPYTMFSTHFFDDTITLPFAVLALVQIPFYGIFLAIGARKKKLKLAAISITILHFIALLLCLLIPMPNFS